MRLIISLVNIVLAVVQGLLGLRFILRLFGASSGAPFVKWIYSTTQSLLEPFLGMFPAPAIDGGFVIEFTTLFAILAYSLIGYLAMALLRWLDDLGVRRTFVHAHPRNEPSSEHGHEHINRRPPGEKGHHV